MRKELFQEFEIPGGIEIVVDGNKVNVKGEKGEISKTFNLGKLKFEKKENKISVGYEKSTKTEKKMMNTIVAHIKNMVKGVTEGYEYELMACYSHFPMTLERNGNKVTIKNFLGEKISRHVSIPNGAEVKIDSKAENKKLKINVSSFDKEIAGQTAANFEMATKIRNRDRRVFQDGIFITKKDGREM